MIWDKIARTASAWVFLAALAAAVISLMLLTTRFITWLIPFLSSMSVTNLLFLFVASILVLYCSTLLLTHYDEKINNPD